MTTSKRKGDILCAAFVRTVTQTSTYSDGNDRNLRVDESGGQHWFQRVSINGKRRNMGLGKYPSVSLAEARKAAWADVTMIIEWQDPISEKREKTGSATSAHPNLLQNVGDRHTNAETDLVQRETRRLMERHARDLRAPKDRVQAGH